MSNPLKTRLALRSAVIILSLLVILGVLIVAASVLFLTWMETRDQQRQLEGLMSTVENTAQVAAFLEDEQLANEIVVGLMANRTVLGVAITSGEHVIAVNGPNLAGLSASALAQQYPDTLNSRLLSPFNPEEQVGTILLIPNREVIRQQVLEAVLLASGLLVLQILGIGLVVILVVVRMITRPITSISNRLHHLQVEIGEKLQSPRGNEHDEVGRLVLDVNAMIDYLVKLLNVEKNLRTEIEVNERKFRSIFENAQSAIFVCDGQGVLQSYNLAFLREFDLSPQRLTSSAPPTLFQLVGNQGAILQTALRECLDSKRSHTIEIAIGNPRRWLELVLGPDNAGSVQIIANEITALKDASAQAERRASTDALTGLGNRLGFTRRLSRLQIGEPFALLYLDLDHFKKINDTHGHQAGDRVLIKVSETLRQLARKTDYIARLGGDEFVLVLEGLNKTQTEIATRLAGNILAALDVPMTIYDDVSVLIGASIGIAFGESGKTSSEQVIQQADQAMYRAKQEGRQRYCIHSD